MDYDIVVWSTVIYFKNIITLFVNNAPCNVTVKIMYTY